MDNDFTITVKQFSQSWPLFAVTGGEDKDRDNLITEVLTNFQQRGIRALVVKDSAEINIIQKDKQISNVPDGVLFLGSDFSHCIKKRVCDVDLLEEVAPFIASYDLIIVSSDFFPPIDTVHLVRGDEPYKEQSTDVIHAHRLGDEISCLIDFLWQWLQKKINSIPVWACVLIGGKSSRMGQPKHLLKGKNGKTWVENCVKTLQEVTTEVVISGAGEVPTSLAHLPRMVDIENVKGPITGILSAMRWNPSVSWLLVACDMPDIQRQGLDWLMSMRKPGVWGAIPCHQQTGYYEPLLALYDFRSGQLFEEMLSHGCLRIGQIGKNPKISTPQIPSVLESSWRNCNTPEDLSYLK